MVFFDVPESVLLSVLNYPCCQKAFCLQPFSFCSFGCHNFKDTVRIISEKCLLLFFGQKYSNLFRECAVEIQIEWSPLMEIPKVKNLNFTWLIISFLHCVVSTYVFLLCFSNCFNWILVFNWSLCPMKMAKNIYRQSPVKSPDIKLLK